MRSGPLAPMRVTVHPAPRGSLAPALFGIGTVEARRTYLIGPTAAGRVRRVAVDVGDAVKAGQLLAEMDPVDLDERAGGAGRRAGARRQRRRRGAGAARRTRWPRRELAAHQCAPLCRPGRAGFHQCQRASRPSCRSRPRPMPAVSAAEANLAAARQDPQRLAAERAGLRQQRDNVRLLAPADGVVTAATPSRARPWSPGRPWCRLVEPDIAVGATCASTRAARPAWPPACRPRSCCAPTRRSRWPARWRASRPSSDSVTEERIAQVAFDTPARRACRSASWPRSP